MTKMISSGTQMVRLHRRETYHAQRTNENSRRRGFGRHDFGNKVGGHANDSNQ